MLFKRMQTSNLVVLKDKRTLHGIILMLCHAAAMAVIYIVCKKLMHGLYPEQVTFLYKFAVLFAILPWCLRKGGYRNLKTTKFSLHLVRSLFTLMAQICFFYGLKYVKAVDATAITYLENVFMLFVGLFLFPERVTSGKIVMISAGVIGTLLVTKPGFHEFDQNYLFLFAAVIFWGIANTIIKLLGKTERTKVQVFYSSFFGSIFAFPFVLLHGWDQFQFGYLKYIVLLAITHFIHSVAFFKSLKLAEISTVMPFDYARLIFTGFLSYAILSEVPDTYSLMGYIVIVIGGCYLVFKEGKNRYFSKDVKMELSSGSDLL